MNKRIIHTESGDMVFELDMAAGEVEVLMEDRERAEILLEPVQPGDEVAAELISRTRHTSRGSVLELRVPHPAPSTFDAGTTVIQQCFGGGVQTMVVSGGVTVVNGQVISGHGATRTFRGGAVRVTARLPFGSRLKATTVSADVVAGAHLASVEFQSTSGDLCVFQAHQLRAHTVSGRVSIDVADEVIAETTSGDVRVGEADDVRARSVSGDIEVQRLTGPRAELVTTSGDVELEAGRDCEVTARTVSGDIRITARDGVRVNTRTRTVSGRVRTPGGKGQ